MKIVRSNRCFYRSLIGCLVGLLALSGTAEAWWNKDWGARKLITIDPKGASITEPIGAVPVLIRLHEGDFQFELAREDGSDIRFVTEDDKTVLSHHIERFDSLLYEAFAWVKVPDLKPGEPLKIWLYYGNAAPDLEAGPAPKETYDKDTVLVYHFAESGSAPADSSAAANNASNPGLPAGQSMIGSGVRFEGTPAGVITIPDSPSLQWPAGGDLTWSAWIKPAVFQPNAVIYSRRDDSGAFLIGLDNGVPFVEVTDGGSTQRSGPGAPMTVNSWNHLAVAASGSTITLYVNGETYATLAAPIPTLSGAAQLGGAATADAGATTADAGAEAGNEFSGEMDELEISRVARPPGFIKFLAVNEGSEGADKLLNLGEDEAPKNWLSWMETGYFGIIIKSLTLDGWVVIVILMIMGVISWFVMIRKAAYLNGVSKGTALFMRKWGEMSSDLTVLDHEDADVVKSMGGLVDGEGDRLIRQASVYRIYRVGAEEIRHRLAEDRKSSGGKLLKARSIQAIRASLDGSLVRETQKLNRNLVLLTIAISGGPFLGLLGTVIGVMITFAAVAAAGDVNVNAIAPGIAAALLATVAGLGVAIPSLFGYNYLISRVKESTSDMHVFVDEFVAKMAEFYSGKAEPALDPND